MALRWLVSILTIPAMLCGCSTAQPGQLAVAFYNCENFFDARHDSGKADEEFTPEGKYHYTENLYHQKLHNIAAVLQHMTASALPDGPALIGLAEVENDHVLNDLVNQPEISERGYKYVWFNGPDERGINVALLYRPQYFKLLDARPLPVILDGAVAKEHTRDVLYVWGILAGDTVHLLVNHWPSRLGGREQSEPKRLIAAAVAKNKITAILHLQPSANILVLGDFNDNPTDEAITTGLGATAVIDTTANNLYNPFTSIYQSGQGTLEYKHHWDLFDQILVSASFFKKNAILHFGKPEIFKPGFIVDHYARFEGYPHRSFLGTHWINGYSDHFPVILYLSR